MPSGSGAPAPPGRGFGALAITVKPPSGHRAGHDGPLSRSSSGDVARDGMPVVGPARWPEGG